jgi:hypothetical protein
MKRATLLENYGNLRVYWLESPALRTVSFTFSNMLFLPLYRRKMTGTYVAIHAGLVVVHRKEVVAADLSLMNCGLSSGPKLSLSLAGFLKPVSSTRCTATMFMREERMFEDWYILPTHTPRFSNMQTDIFLYGCVVYQLMTGTGPNSPNQQPEPRPQMLTHEYPRGS